MHPTHTHGDVTDNRSGVKQGEKKKDENDKCLVHFCNVDAGHRQRSTTFYATSRSS